MTLTLRAIAIFTVIFLLTSCISGVDVDKNTKNYVYGGETYGIIEISFSHDIADKPEKIKKFKQLQLAKKIKKSLKKYKIFNEKSPNKINIVINKLRLRSMTSAFLLGSKVGPDLLEGNVSISRSSDEGAVLSFEVASRQLRGGAFHAGESYRLNRLGRHFSEVTVKTILGKIK